MNLRLFIVFILLSSLAFADGKSAFESIIAAPYEQWSSIIDASALTPDDVSSQGAVLAQMVKDKTYEQAILEARAIDTAAVKVLGLPPGDNRQQVLLTAYLAARGEKKFAQQVVANMNADSPTAGSTLFAQGLLVKDLNPTAAVNLFSQARTSNLPDLFMEECLQDLAVAYASLGKTDLLEQTAKDILKINPNNGFALDVVRSFDEPASNTPVSASSAGAIASFDKAEAAFSKGDFPGALKFYDEAIAADPKFVKAWIYKGDALLQLGKVDEAITCYRKAIAIDPKDKQAHRFLGDTLHRKYQSNGDRKLLTEAISHFEIALKIDPNYAMARDSLAAAKAEMQR